MMGVIKKSPDCTQNKAAGNKLPPQPKTEFSMPIAYLQKERRVFPRILVEVPVAYAVMQAESEIQSAKEERRREKHGHTLDVSLGGLFLLSDETLKEGWVLTVSVFIPGAQEKISATAEVVWANETGGGVRFLTMKESDMKTLKAYLDKAGAR